MQSKRFAIGTFFLATLISLLILACNPSEIKDKPEDGSFSFVFATDIHLQPEMNAIEGFARAVDSINKLNPDFVLTGGDLIMDALGTNYERADSLYSLYENSLKGFKMPVYNTIGNHEIFGIYKNSGIDSTHPKYGDKMYEERLGKRYYAFDHKGWRFYIIDSIEETPERKYKGFVDSVQIEWIERDLRDVDENTPIVISTHIPFISSFMQYKYGALSQNGKGLVINNSKEVLDLFKEHNLKLVLQGHLHYLEDIWVDGIHFITGGAVSAGWWSGPHNNVEEGFLEITMDEEDFDWRYIDYGWEAVDEKDVADK